jgi:predicted enzyme related to lactoylglutathione lyase
MMNNVMYFEIQADDLETARTFYGEIFGWKFTKQEGLPVEYWSIQTDGINGGLLKRPAPAPGDQQGTNAYTCSMEVENYDEMSNEIITRGGTIALPKFAVPGKCWQGYFLDPQGNTFGIFQVDEKAK